MVASHLKKKHAFIEKNMERVFGGRVSRQASLAGMLEWAVLWWARAVQLPSIQSKCMIVCSKVGCFGVVCYNCTSNAMNAQEKMTHDKVGCRIMHCNVIVQTGDLKCNVTKSPQGGSIFLLFSDL